MRHTQRSGVHRFRAQLHVELLEDRSLLNAASLATVTALKPGSYEPGHILVSEAVYQQVRNKIPAEFRDEGVRTLKNIEHPVRVYSLAPSALVATNRKFAIRLIRFRRL